MTRNNEFKEINMKNRTYYCFDDMIEKHKSRCENI